jgi:glucose-6-phosphate-specific signal transduction histidine kinase
MWSSPLLLSRADSGDPWFQHRPRLVLGVIAALFVSVFVLRLVTGSSVEPYSMFYVLPVALAATAFGERGGLVAALVALVLIVVSTLLLDVTHGPGGWAARVVPLLLLGLLLGRATDRVRRAEAEHRRLEVAALLHREAIEINDTLIQQMTAAKWALEAGRTDAGLAALEQAMAEAHQMVSELIRRAEMGERSEPVSGLPEAPSSRG